MYPLRERRRIPRLYIFIAKKEEGRQTDTEYARRVIKSREFENQSPSAFRFAARRRVRFRNEAFRKNSLFLSFHRALSPLYTYILYTPYFASSIAPRKDRRRFSKDFPAFPALSSAFPSPCTRRGSAPTMGLHGPGEVEEEEGNEGPNKRERGR